jgi:hypothetical protein
LSAKLKLISHCEPAEGGVKQSVGLAAKEKLAHGAADCFVHRKPSVSSQRLCLFGLETARNSVFEPTVQRRGSERSCGFRFALAVWVITNLS